MESLQTDGRGMKDKKSLTLDDRIGKNTTVEKVKRMFSLNHIQVLIMNIMIFCLCISIFFNLKKLSLIRFQKYFVIRDFDGIDRHFCQRFRTKKNIVSNLMLAIINLT